MSAEHEYAIELQGVSFQRGARSIFDKVDIRIPRGKVTGIMGPSGCGKTTLLRLIRLLNDALGITSVVVSHDLAETASIADYIYVVGDAQVLGQGTPAELMESDNPRIRQFMKGIPDGPVPFHFPAPDYREDLLGRG